MGLNPNMNVEDDYIGNLQQQIHFMELEMKILKEKVVDDEKKSGIGSLFDDEKSSWQHISQMKQKYQKMRRDYDRQSDELNKRKLGVVGDQFELDAQINIMLVQNQKIEEQCREYDGATKKRLFELEKDLKDVSKQKFDLENEIRMLEQDLARETSENYTAKMTIGKDKEFEELNNARFTLEVALQRRLLEEKDAEVKRFREQRAAVKMQFEQNAELQQGLQEEVRLKREIEDALVRLDLLNIQVKELEEATESLTCRKEALMEEKKQAEQRNEELRKELQAKEEIAVKRLQAKLARDKNVEVKELIAQEETATEHN